MLYIGATKNLKVRVEKHREGRGAVFTKKYHLKHLVYYEVLESPNKAFIREKQLKNWRKEWKWNLIKFKNMDLLDLFQELT